MAFRCHHCEKRVATVGAVCQRCGGFVSYTEPDRSALREAVNGDPTAGLPEYQHDVRMGEGETPTVEITSSGLEPTVYGKLESLNPTCSFKDRGSSLAVSAVRDSDTSWEALVVASTGNTAPSVAAYAARAGVPCAVLVPEGTSLSKLSQVDAHDVSVYTLEGNFSDCFRLAQRASDERILNATAVYSANPFVVSANRTVAFEIVAQLGRAPEWVSVPVGAGPLLGGVVRGFTELRAANIIETIPRTICVQAHGCHPIVQAIERDEPVRPWIEPITTDVGAIADPLDGYAVDGEETRRAVDESNGEAVALSDERIHTWTDRLATREGIYAEPASAASIAAVAEGFVDPDDTVVGLITGHGLKEPGERRPPSKQLDDDPAKVRAALLDS